MTKKKETFTSPFVPEEEQPYQIPENWCWVKLEDISEIIMGQSPVGSDTTDDSSYMPLIGGAADMGIMYPLATRYTKVPTKVSKNGDLILCIRATLGKPIFSNGEYCLGRGVAAVRPYAGPKEYYRYFLLNFEQYLYDNATGTTFAQVSSKILQKMPVPFSPLSEQQRIVDRIESLFAKLDEAKEKAQAVVDSFELRRSAILHKAFTGELTERWRKEHGVGLDSWKMVSFNDCIQKMQNGLAKRSGSIGENYVVLRLANLSEDGFDTSDLRKILLDEKEQETYSLLENDVIMIRVNGSKDNVGRQLLVPDVKKWAFCDHIIRIRYQNNVLPDYMVLFSKSDNYRAYVKDHMVSSAGQNTISRKGMVNMAVPVPKCDEQREIVRTLSGLFNKEQQSKEAAEAVLSQIDTMKKAILARAFRGELGTNDPAEEWAGEMLKHICQNSWDK